MAIDYLYKKKELGSQETLGLGPTNWSGLPEGEKIHLSPEPELPHSARKAGNDMIVHGPGGAVLDDNHEVDHSVDPIAGETRKVKMKCP